MKISEIRDQVFGTARDWTLTGFSRMPDYANLYTHSSWPGLIFRRVANVRQAMMFGGVIVGDDNYEMIIASKNAGGVGDWTLGLGVASADFELKPSPYFVRSDKTGFFECEAVASSMKTNSTGLVDTAQDRPLVPTYGMAVVSNISMLGFRSKIARNKDAFFGTKVSVTNAKPEDVYIDGSAGAQTTALVPLTQYLVQWAEIPFAQNGGDFVRKAVPALASEYPSKISSEMAKVMGRVAADPIANPDSASTFVLTRVVTSKQTDPVWGGITRGLFCDAGLVVSAKKMVTLEPSGGEQPPLSRTLGPIYGPFFDANRKILLVPGELAIAGGFLTADMPAKLKVASNFVIDMTKFHQEFAPASEVPPLTGEKDYFEIIKGSTLDGLATISDKDAVAQRPVRRHLLEPLGSRSVEIDLQNLLNRAEAVVMDERIYGATTGTAFGDASGQGAIAPLVAQSTGYIYTKEVAEARGDKSGKNLGCLVYESEGEFVVPEDGTYEIVLHSNGTELLDNVSSHGMIANGCPRRAAFSKGAKYTIGRGTSGYSWFCRSGQTGAAIAFYGPNFAHNQLCVDKGMALQYQITTSEAPTHGMRGTNGAVFGMRQQVQGGPVGSWCVTIRAVSAG